MNQELGKKSHYSSVGFTFVEILLVIAIIGMVSTAVLVSFPISQKFQTARDTKRQSDIKQYQTAVENYASSHSGLFPRRATTVGASDILCADLGLASCPSDAKQNADSTFGYNYQTDGGLSDGQARAAKYVLWSKLEATVEYFVVCSSGRSGKVSQTNFSVSGGNCPI